jgi:protoporphyrinogen oxidase
MSEIVVVGGGISGLSVAHFLSKKGFKPVILEREGSVGGLGSWYDIDGFSIDSSYHIIFKNDVHLLNLLKELDMADDVVWGSLKFSLDSPQGSLTFSPMEIMKSNVLSKNDRIRLANMYVRLKLLRDWRRMDRVSAREWIEENGSTSIYRNVFEPIIRSKWGTDSDEVSAAWFFGRVKPRSDSRDILSRSEMAGYLAGSFKRMFSFLEKGITRSGGNIIKNADARKISFSGKKPVVRYGKGNTEIAADAVVSTVPLPELARIANLPTGFGSVLRNFRYRSFICTVFGFDRPVTGSFRTVFSGYDIPFGGIVELTNLVSPRHFNGQHIVYAFHFLDGNDEMFFKSDEDILRIHASFLDSRFPDTSRRLLWSRMCRNAYAEPFYQKNYLDIMPGIRTPVSRLFITGMFQSYPVSDYNNIISLGKKTADVVGEDIS